MNFDELIDRINEKFGVVASFLDDEPAHELGEAIRDAIEDLRSGQTLHVTKRRFDSQAFMVLSRRPFRGEASRLLQFMVGSYDDLTEEQLLEAKRLLRRCKAK